MNVHALRVPVPYNRSLIVEVGEIMFKRAETAAAELIHPFIYSHQKWLGLSLCACYDNAKTPQSTIHNPRPAISPASGCLYFIIPPLPAATPRYLFASLQSQLPVRGGDLGLTYSNYPA
jgi:hypothetical protein